jgi:lipopolysaccharide transport system permease protein
MQLIDPQAPELSQAPADAPVEPTEPGWTIIRPPTGWQLVNVRELWHARDLLFFLVWRDVKVRYKQTVLGIAWAVLQPGLLMVVFSLFFHRLAAVSSGELPYPLFVFAGLLPWTFFAGGLSNGGNSVVGAERLITKIYFPRLAIPLAAVGAALVDFLIACGLLALLMIGYGVAPGWSALWLPVIMVCLLLMTAGMGTLLAALNVAYRDVRYVIPFLVQVWMFATPSVYMELFAQPPSEPLVRALLYANPLTGLIAAFRAALLGSTMPWDLLAYGAVMSVVVFIVGCLYFRKVEDSFADVI